MPEARLQKTRAAYQPEVAGWILARLPPMHDHTWTRDEKIEAPPGVFFYRCACGFSYREQGAVIQWFTEDGKIVAEIDCSHDCR